jgi:glycosyltransferase 2 family protein
MALNCIMNTKTALKFALGIVLLAGVLYKVGLDNLWEVTKQANPFFIVLTFLALLLTFLPGAYNIKILLDAINKKLPFLKTFKYFVISNTLGLVLPGKLGEASIIYFLKKEGVSIGEATVVSVMDKIITIIGVSTLAFFGLPYFFNVQDSLLLIGVTVILITAVIFLILSTKVRTFIREYILRKYARYFTGFGDTITLYLHEKKKALAWNLVVTWAKWMFSCSVVYLLFLAFHSNISFFAVVMVNSVMFFISMIPLTISGLGVKEASAVYFYHLLGVAPEVTLGVHLMMLVIKHLVGFALIMFFWDTAKKVRKHL